MSVSRRRFLRTGAIVSAAFVLKPATAALGKNSPWSSSFDRAHGHARAGSNPVHSYSREMFEPYIGDVFRVRVGKQTVDLKLVALTAVEPTATGITTGKIARTDCFSMRFHASKPLPANARTHQLSHSQLGNFDLFMSQSSNGREFVQTAVVNHLI
jgi:hypothetical protein